MIIFSNFILRFSIHIFIISKIGNTECWHTHSEIMIVVFYKQGGVKNQNQCSIRRKSISGDITSSRDELE